ncbi:MAG: PSD1 and planctomycete cytochrome C domain-containing protein, partial [Limisphaerales bacterium]
MVKKYQGLEIPFNTGVNEIVILPLMLFPHLRLWTLVSALVLGAGTVVPAAEPLSFSRDVLPVLSENCFSCHGPDESHRKAGLRLDRRGAAVESGAIVPGYADKSELIHRIVTRDEDELMPPPDSHKKPLTPPQVKTLKRWIGEGAEWGRHWSFEKPRRPAPPIAGGHPIDAFVRARLKDENLAPAKRAPAHTQLRRVSYGLTGLPPSFEEIEAFATEPTDDAWEQAIDRLLASKHFGERMAMWWLDAARYADTDGYQGDRTRNNWPWREWVVDAFNANEGFDRFTIEQFAGDLLPNATERQKLATCFHRNHMTNGEGGRHPEESRIDYVIDRVNTMGTVWLGLTLGCTQCHSHKFDPISQHDYYRLFAFFNSIDEDGKAGSGAKPFMKYQSPYAARAVKEAGEFLKQVKPVQDRARKDAELRFKPWLEKQVLAVCSGFTSWHSLTAKRLHSVEGTVLKQDDDGIVTASGLNPFQDDYHLRSRPAIRRITGLRLEVFPDPANAGRVSRGDSGSFILTDVKLMLRKDGSSQLADIDFASAVADVEKKVKGRAYGNIRDTLDDDPRNGWTVEAKENTKKRTGVFALAEPLELAEDEELIFVMLHRSTIGDGNIGRYRVSVTDQPGAAVRNLKPMPMALLAEAGATNEAGVSGDLRKQLFEQFLVDDVDWQRKLAAYGAAGFQLSEFKKGAQALNVMVLAERKEPRESHVLVRGVWDKKGDVVKPAVLPTMFERAAAGDQTRLDLAEWLVSRDHPLTARVIVNQVWQLMFGAALVRTPEDFGLQGEAPTHPRLLDWLAVEFMESGWDVKHLMKTIAMSETYRQSSVVSPELLERDPENRLLARAPRFRLPSWMIRDGALKAAGLLNSAIGGPPVRPYQPVGVWREMFMGRFTYQPSVGPAQFRRTLYAFWRRSSAPTFLFDSSQRRMCEVRPRRTNTPLHALTLLNDTSMLESARHIARKGGVKAMFRTV